MLSSLILPFVFGEAELLARLPSQVADYTLQKIPIHQKAYKLAINKPNPHADQIIVSPARFARILNIMNGLAYGGGMGMPEWVMLDCALLPSFFAGFMGPAHLLTASQRDLINAQLMISEADRSEIRSQLENSLTVTTGKLQDDEYVPLAEFCALARGPLTQILAFSLYSFKRGLGISAKALGLALWNNLGYQEQMGVAQWTNIAAVRAHLRFGRLEVIEPFTAMHTKAGESFIYKLQIPEISTLEQLIQSGLSRQASRKVICPSDKLEKQQWQLVYDSVNQRQLMQDVKQWFDQRIQEDKQVYIYGIREQDAGYKQECEQESKQEQRKTMIEILVGS